MHCLRDEDFDVFEEVELSRKRIRGRRSGSDEVLGFDMGVTDIVKYPRCDGDCDEKHHGSRESFGNGEGDIR